MSATHVTSQVLQPKSVKKWYRGRHTFISLYCVIIRYLQVSWNGPNFFGLELLPGFEYRARVELGLIIPSSRACLNLVEPNGLDHSCKNLAYFLLFPCIKARGL